ncbi:MAG: hypothetical protein EA361_03270 [Bacteroidetes bacterium]|nr:MAG: hypothetical protein EA361_03270 [Bacteroidota bacterium]
MKKKILTLGLFAAILFGANNVSGNELNTIECTDFIIICKYGEMHFGIACGGTQQQRYDDVEELAEMLC